jgi:hypothetical protein
MLQYIRNNSMSLSGETQAITTSYRAAFLPIRFRARRAIFKKFQ